MIGPGENRFDLDRNEPIGAQRKRSLFFGVDLQRPELVLAVKKRDDLNTAGKTYLCLVKGAFEPDTSRTQDRGEDEFAVGVDRRYHARPT